MMRDRLQPLSPEARQQVMTGSYRASCRSDPQASAEERDYDAEPPLVMAGSPGIVVGGRDSRSPREAQLRRVRSGRV